MRRSRKLARREVLAVGLASTAGVLAGCSRPMPPTYGNLLRMGDNLTYAAHRLLLPGQTLVKEYPRSAISNFPAVGTADPGDPAVSRVSEAYRAMQRRGFADWTLSVEGAVARPGSFSLADLKAMPSRTQITKHACEEGWTTIGEWTGVPLSRVLDAVGLKPEARFVSYVGIDGNGESIDLLDALHPQTILAYGFNDRPLTPAHGAPLRLYSPIKLGYKMTKYLTKMTLTAERPGGFWEDQGYPWLGGV